MPNILASIADFLNRLAPTLQGEARYHARVSAYLLEICQRETSAAHLPQAVDNPHEAALAAAIRAGAHDATWNETLAQLLETAQLRAAVTRPGAK